MSDELTCIKRPLQSFSNQHFSAAFFEGWTKGLNEKHCRASPCSAHTHKVRPLPSTVTDSFRTHHLFVAFHPPSALLCLTVFCDA